MKHIRWLIVLCACQNPGQWSQSQMKTVSAAYDSSRLTYHSKNFFGGIDLEWIDFQEESILYLQVHGTPIQNPLIRLKLDDKWLEFQGFLHEGGHRLSLPEAYQIEILSSLHQRGKIFIQIDDYREEIDGASQEEFLSKQIKAILGKKGVLNGK